MKFLLVFFPVFVFSSILDDRIFSESQDVCYYKNLGNGLSASDYSPVLGTQTPLQNGTTEIYSCESSIPTNYNCDDWISDPFVTSDLELYKIVADMSCTIQQEDSTTQGCYNYTRVISQYQIDVDCQTNCQIPESNGQPYTFGYGFDEASCNTSNLQSLYANENPSSTSYIADAQYITCPSQSATGCYYLLASGGNDNNSTDDNSTTGGTGGSFSTTDSENLSSIENNLDRLVDKLLDDSAVNDYSAPETSFSDLGQSINNTSQSMREGFDSILSSFSAYAPPVFIGNTDTSIFTAVIYGEDIVFDLKMFNNLRSAFDILWLLMLAYFSFKIHFFIIRDILNKL